MTDPLDQMTAPTVADALLGEDGMPRREVAEECDPPCPACLYARTPAEPINDLAGQTLDMAMIERGVAAFLSQPPRARAIEWRPPPGLQEEYLSEDPADRYRRLSKDTPHVSAQAAGTDPGYVVNLRKNAPHEIRDGWVRGCGHCDKPIGKVYRTLNGAVLCSDACWEAEVRGELATDVDGSQLAKLGNKEWQ